MRKVYTSRGLRLALLGSALLLNACGGTTDTPSTAIQATPNVTSVASATDTVAAAPSDTPALKSDDPNQGTPSAVSEAEGYAHGRCDNSGPDHTRTERHGGRSRLQARRERLQV